jgi:hypothetical protein
MTIAMPYESLAERLGITVASARKLVLRRLKCWPLDAPGGHGGGGHDGSLQLQRSEADDV